MGNFNNNFLNIRDDVSINPSIIDPFRPQSFRVQTAIPPPTPANPAYIESSPPNQPPISVPQPFSPEMSVINQPQLFSHYPVPNYPPPNYPIPNYSSPYPPPQYPSQYPNPYPACYPKFQNTSSQAPSLGQMHPEQQNLPQNLEMIYPELQELRDKQKNLISTYMDEINTLKAQKQSLVQDMISSKKQQMEDDHKMFQDKLNELKSSMLTPQAAVNPTPVSVKGSEILAELDRMKERLQKGRAQPPTIHPSEKTMKQIIIDNPIADKKIDSTNYEPRYQTMQNKEFENSLPNK